MSFRTTSLRALGGEILGGLLRQGRVDAARRAAASAGSRYAMGGVARLRPGGFLVPTGFAPTARVALNRGHPGPVVKHSGRGGVPGIRGPMAPSRQSVAAQYLRDCDGPTLILIATRRISQLEGFVHEVIRVAQSQGKTAIASRLECASGKHFDVDTKGLLEALEITSGRIKKRDLVVSSRLETLRAELFDLACRASGIRQVLRKTGGI